MTFPPSLFRNITPTTSTPPSATISPPINQIHPDHTPTPSMDHSDDESINSVTSSPKMSLVIKPCDTYTKYGVWLRQQFPHIMTMSIGDN